MLGAGLAVAFIAGAAVADAKEMTVQMAEATIRAKPSNLEPAAAVLKLGEVVQVLEEKGPWVKVSAKGGETGWMSLKSLVKGNVSMKSGEETAAGGASSSETAMAGKGFSPEVEKSYREKNPTVDYSWVDKMEKWKTSTESMREFLKAGKVEPKEGGAK
jgi:uncharacterized protein YgiM (DUF1202 family)